MPSRLSSVAVLGAGVMGSQLAAHLANAGLDVTLLDVTRRAAEEGLARAARATPAPFFDPTLAQRIQPGALDDLTRATEADWVLEAVIEDLEVKRGLFARLDGAGRGDAVISSNTSAIPIAALAVGRSDEFRRRFLGTHFFNPPRYLHLVEIVPGTETAPEIVATTREWLDRRLGKGVVRAHDRPGFIANRIGIFGAMRALDLVARGEATIEEIDAVTGPLVGRPKSATFRTIDLAGLDVLLHVARDLAARLDGAEGAAFRPPAVLDALVGGGRLGVKTGAGFYRRQLDGDRAISVLDVPALTYRAPAPRPAPSLERARALRDPIERLRLLIAADDWAGQAVRATIGATLVYAARVAAEVADDFDDVDRAMTWGFGWDLGPFQTLHAAGATAVFDACAAGPVPDAVAHHLEIVDRRVHPSRLPATSSDLIPLDDPRQRVVAANPDASVVDLGDGVLALALHTKLNLIGPGVLEMIHAALTAASAQGVALVIGTDATTFSAGANLKPVIAAAQAGRWAEIDAMVRAFQTATDAIKRSAVPVVAAPTGLCIGGGCEIAMHADRRHAAAESYIGLVETSVGLVPAGGGSRELLARASGGAGDDLAAAVQRAFERVALARVSTSAADARALGYLRESDGVTMNPRRVLQDAKRIALERARAGYQPPAPRAVTVGGPDLYARLALGVHLAWRAGRATDHDRVVGRKLAWLFAGGDVAHRTTVSEAHLLDLEREAFLGLCGEAKTVARMVHTLETGKPLRN